ncbi:MAG: S8 family serine peptidase [Bacteroidota bacterium]
MKTMRTFLWVAVYAIALPLFAQNVQFSANTKAFLIRSGELSALKSNVADVASGLSQFYPVMTIGSRNYIGALIKVLPDIDRRGLEELGVRINTCANDIWSVMIPLSSLESLKEIRGLEYVEVDGLVRQRLDNATTESNVRLVHAEIGVKSKCLGDSVIVGIVDDGFDYTHPTFYDTTGAKLRILRAWEQSNTAGPRPDGFSYGTEIVGTQPLLDKKSSGEGNHGTHVAGIAGGSGYLTPGAQYRGVAPDANLIFVEYNDGATAIGDGINYVFKQAEALGRPAVVNLSLGTHIGPHDGTSALDQMIDNLVGPGRIVAGAAGNEGDTPLHLAKLFNNDTIRTFVAFENNPTPFRAGMIDQWGSPDSDFAMGISVSDSNGTLVASTPFYKASENPNVKNVIMMGNDSLAYTVTGVSSSALNGKPNLLATVSRLKKEYVVTLILTSANTQLNIWNHGVGEGAGLYDKLNGIIQAGYTAGDTVCTVGEIGGTSKKIITVGAYTTKASFVNMKGNTISSYDALNTLAYFSSRGPTVDGRTKPEITAPGEQLVSSVNSWDPAYNETNDKTVMRVEQGSSKWFFAAMQGTSMATPMTTGVIALMLQANPNLGPERVKELLQENARTDSYTGVIPPAGSNKWGWGKIDAQQSVQAAFNVLGITWLGNSVISVYPNPARGIVNLKNDGSGSFSAAISVINMSGVTVKETFHYWNGGGIYQFDLSLLPMGAYIITLTGNNDLKASLKVQLTR